MRQQGDIKIISNPRKIWKNELDFSDWIARGGGMSKLNREIGLNMIPKETEAMVGQYRADIYAVDKNTQKKVIIENQLGSTNHDHLGKIITYASGRDANIIIWIAKNARIEHREAIKWLNNQTNGEISFYLVEFKTTVIDRSRPGTTFNIVERPYYSKSYEDQIADITHEKNIYKEFWETFCKEAIKNKRFSSQFLPRSPKNSKSAVLAVGHSFCHIIMQFLPDEDSINIQLEFTKRGLKTYKFFEKHKITINKILKTRLTWTSDKNQSNIIYWRDNIDATNRDKWIKYSKWLCSKALKFKGIVDDCNF